MGDDPQFMVVKRWDTVPDGYFVPDQTFVDKYYDQLYTYSDFEIPWSIVAYNGGVFYGSGYVMMENYPPYECGVECQADPMYHVFDD